MLFSDIEGSTRLVHTLGDAWPGLLARQRELCRAAWVAHRGREVATEGDSFFVVFDDAADGVSAAIEAQRRLSAGPWPDGVAVRVRIGLHTGSPARLEDGYAGLDVHRGARIAGAAHGGQVLASAAAVEAAGLTGSVDLGWHQLKDLPDRLHHHQVVAEGLAESFPPIRSRGTLGGLPATEGPIIGREVELGVLSRLVEEGVRVVTLTGPGGSGKTRLATAFAAQVANRYAHGVYFVPLVGASEPGEAWPEIGRVLGLSEDPRDQMGDLDALLVLDNLEQCDGADDLVRELLVRAPEARVVATTRRALHVEPEREVAVHPLETSSAIELFRARSSTWHRAPASTDLEELVRRLDGLPLAIEIAAARTRVLSPTALLARLDGILDLPGRRRDARQRTIRATVAWSYDLLDPVPQRVLDCLGTFVDGASLPGLGAVTTAEDLDGRDLLDVLFELVDASLVQVADSDDGEPRFSLLETIRAFAVDRLDARGARLDREMRHAQFFYDLERAAFAARHRDAYSGLLGQFVPEIANVRAALSRRPRVVDLDYGDSPVPPSHVAALFSYQAFYFDRLADARAWAESGLADVDDQPGRAALLCQSGVVAALTEQHDLATRDLDEALAAAEIAIAEGADLPRWVDPRRTAFRAARELTCLHLDREDFEQARRGCDQAARFVGDDPEVVAMMHELRFLVSAFSGDHEQARSHLSRQREVIDAAGLHQTLSVWTNNMADMELHLGELEAARRRLAESCETVLASGDVSAIRYFLGTFAAAIGPIAPELAAQARGCVLSLQSREGLGISQAEEQWSLAELTVPMQLLGSERWAAEVAIGARTDVAQVLRSMAAAVASRPDLR